MKMDRSPAPAYAFRFLLLVLLATGGAARASAGSEKAGGSGAKCVLRVDPEIDCPSCEDGIKRVLTNARGVQSVEVDVLTDRITVRYDAARINVKALIGRVAVTGYAASEVK